LVAAFVGVMSAAVPIVEAGNVFGGGVACANAYFSVENVANTNVSANDRQAKPDRSIPSPFELDSSERGHDEAWIRQMIAD
jgi:hypothetical protein